MNKTLFNIPGWLWSVWSPTSQSDLSTISSDPLTHFLALGRPARLPPPSPLSVTNNDQVKHGPSGVTWNCLGSNYIKPWENLTELCKTDDAWLNGVVLTREAASHSWQFRVSVGPSGWQAGLLPCEDWPVFYNVLSPPCLVSCLPPDPAEHLTHHVTSQGQTLPRKRLRNNFKKILNILPKYYTEKKKKRQ